MYMKQLYDNTQGVSQTCPTFPLPGHVGNFWRHLESPQIPRLTIPSHHPLSCVTDRLSQGHVLPEK